MKKRINAMVATIVFLGLFAPVIYAQGKVSSPEEYFGFRMGSDKKIARWDKIVEYFRLMEKQSPRIKVIELGPSTMGHPFLLVIITSAENMTRLERFQKINAAISDPRDIPEAEINDLIKSTDKKLTIAAADLAYEPAVLDQVTVSSRIMQVVEVRKIEQDNTPIVFEIFLRE